MVVGAWCCTVCEAGRCFGSWGELWVFSLRQQLVRPTSRAVLRVSDVRPDGTSSPCGEQLNPHINKPPTLRRHLLFGDLAASSLFDGVVLLP